VAKPKGGKRMVRTTVSVPQSDLDRLEEVARARKVSVSQVIRWAIDVYLESVPTEAQQSLPLRRGQ
jgi:metal-responsive CopG/Arc/MetJ family transcriptional regulator